MFVVVKLNDDSALSTEQKILNATEREFLVKGFAGARTTTIASAAGVTHAMLHYYFRTKENLFDRIISEKLAILKRVFENSVNDLYLSLEDMIRSIICSHLDFISSNPDLPRFIISEIYNHPERPSAIVNMLQTNAPHIIAGIQSKIDRTAAEGRCRKLDANMLMLDIASLNVFSYIAMPVVNAAFGNCMDDAKAFLNRRKEENFDTIMSKLKL